MAHFVFVHPLHVLSFALVWSENVRETEPRGLLPYGSSALSAEHIYIWSSSHSFLLKQREVPDTPCRLISSPGSLKCLALATEVWFEISTALLIHTSPPCLPCNYSIDEGWKINDILFIPTLRIPPSGTFNDSKSPEIPFVYWDQHTHLFRKYSHQIPPSSIVWQQHPLGIGRDQMVGMMRTAERQTAPTPQRCLPMKGSSAFYPAFSKLILLVFLGTIVHLCNMEKQAFGLDFLRFILFYLRWTFVLNLMISFSSPSRINHVLHKEL